ncbi:MAG TPA: GNAT family N-acetyltransferase [Flavobacterium sp.]|uniref:GNAT family N-acetyltransferase n=1 Tax=Flavobacterium sp. TaxID=239 RepID=UPI002BF73E85|nr:GNAT family N-acetyltransferase [Flavobacterium sp.]MCA0348738.1 GNAT family N-acetyltransferase [Bacteroidota bacterium]HPW98636.1 GNAT family N-acetyltransferase [Flavobacterium sp.]HQA74717.1 GNAT family N-acetyltransferase [Flavobacterium sp.]
MNQDITFSIFKTVNELPKEWDIVSQSNAFLQTPYLHVLEQSAPTNMECFYIGIFEHQQLIGVALAQYLDLNKLESFGERDKCLKTYIRNFIFKNFASHALFLGNNMITGQNGFVFSKPMEFNCISEILLNCSQTLIAYFKTKKIKIHIVSFKDFYKKSATELQHYGFATIYEFNTQPNMIFELDKNWKTEADYVSAFSKKYRDQYKRCRKKSEGIVTRELTTQEIIEQEKRIYELYHHVAKNAPFNTFFLAEDHFTVFKKQCGNRFVMVGYFLENELIGFHSLLLNGEVLETYFLGYDEQIQKEKMLYLNMLYNMTAFGIEHQFKKIIFGRTALEIKSSIGAEPIMMSGFIFHTNSFINKFMPKIFPKLEPTLAWQQRHPFK